MLPTRVGGKVYAVDCSRCSALADCSIRRFEAATAVAQYMPTALRPRQRSQFPPAPLLWAFLRSFQALSMA